MKKIFALIITILVFSAPILAFAQESTTTVQDERTQQLQTELGLTIPSETDNPNHIITFKDPSGKGVKLEVDGQGFKSVKSPYTLPSLGIGSHLLTFKFTDDQQSSQTLDKNLVVVPRVPIINAPESVSKTQITLKGTALAGSTIELFISGDTLNFKGTTDVDSDGNWEYTFKENFKYTVYTVIARAKKNGFSSSISQPIVFELSNKDSKDNVSSNSALPIHFDITEINTSNLVSTLQNNPHLIILSGISAILGGIIVWVVESVSSRKVNKTAEGKFINLLNEKDKNRKDKKSSKKTKDTPKGMTLKEKFEKAGFKLPQSEIKEKELSKEEFMAAYKEEDPDNTKGVEKKEAPKPEKKRVAVDLTTKKS